MGALGIRSRSETAAGRGPTGLRGRSRICSGGGQCGRKRRRFRFQSVWREKDP